MKRIINAVVSIEYEQDDNNYWSDMSLEDKDDCALGLCFNPNFNTIENGVRLKSVHIEPVEPYTEIDWDKVKHNPEYLFIKQ